MFAKLESTCAGSQALRVGRIRGGRQWNDKWHLSYYVTTAFVRAQEHRIGRRHESHWLQYTNCAQERYDRYHKIFDVQSALPLLVALSGR